MQIFLRVAQNLVNIIDKTIEDINRDTTNEFSENCMEMVVVLSSAFKKCTNQKPIPTVPPKPHVCSKCARMSVKFLTQKMSKESEADMEKMPQNFVLTWGIRPNDCP